MIRRRRFKQTTSLHDRLVLDARKCRERARELPPGKDRDFLLEKARQDETVAGWATSLSPQPATVARYD
jgi:hypothetical protein